MSVYTNRIKKARQRESVTLDVGLWTLDLLPQPIHRGLLKRAADLTGVAVREIRALNHENERNAADGVHPGRSAPGTAVTEGAGREHRGDTGMWSSQNAGADTPTVIATVITEFFRL